MKLKQNSRLGSNQEGMVAIFTVLVIMGVLTLLTIGFSNITRQAQRRTLDNQLSSQAFYAAETGVNRAWSLINAGTVDQSKTDCLSDPGDYDYGIDTDLGISINCLLINMEPPDIRIDSIPVGDAEVLYLRRAGSAAPITQFTLHWDDDAAGVEHGIGAGAAFSGSRPNLLDNNSWGNNVGMVKVDIIPVGDNFAASMNRQSLVANSYSFFLYPSTHSATPAAGIVESVSSSANAKGVVIARQCETGEYRCRATVSLANTTSDEYYIRLQSYYNSTNIRIEGMDAGNNTVTFTGTQAVVDSTGRASDVSRRLQVRVSIQSENSAFPGLHSSFSILSATSLCKRLIAVPGNSSIDGSDGAGSDPACQINN